jgi:hypothetical protein
MTRGAIWPIPWLASGYPTTLYSDELRAWIPDRDKPDSELRAAIRSAHDKNPQPAKGTAPNEAVKWRQTEQPTSTANTASSLSLIRCKGGNRAALTLTLRLFVSVLSNLTTTKVSFYRWSRTPGVIKWEQADADEGTALIEKKSKKKPQVSDDKLLSVFSLIDAIAASTAEKKMMDLGSTRIDAQAAIRRFIDEELIVATEPANNRGRGKPAEKYVRSGEKSNG